MSDVKEKLLENVYEHLDMPSFFNDVLDEILEPALDKIVNDTANPFDNILKNAIYPNLAVKLKEAAKDQWDELMVKNEATLAK